MSTKNSAPSGIKDLWTVLKEEAAIVKSSDSYDAQSGYETSLVFLGSKSSGKTTLVNYFLDKGNDTLISTIGIDYTYGRRARATSNVKDVVHIWDLAGGTLMTQLLEIPISSATVHTTSVVLCVDLSTIIDLVATLDHFISVLSTRVNDILTGLEKRGSKRPKGLRQFSMKKYGTEHPDKMHLKLIPIQWVLIGTKYDAFRDQPSELRRIVSRILRYYAHIYGGYVLMTSDRIEDSMFSKCKQLISHFGFKTAAPKIDVRNTNRPIHVTVGADSLQDIFAGTSCRTIGDLQTQLSAFLPKQTPSANKDKSNSIPDGLVSGGALQHKAFGPQYAEPLIDQECIY